MSTSGSERVPVVVHVVEDDESSRIASSRVLKSAGYVVRVYATGAEFLAQPPTEAGCLVLDLRLPGPSGLDLQQQLTTAENPLPVSRDPLPFPYRYPPRMNTSSCCSESG